MKVKATSVTALDVAKKYDLNDIEVFQGGNAIKVIGFCINDGDKLRIIVSTPEVMQAPKLDGGGSDG